MTDDNSEHTKSGVDLSAREITVGSDVVGRDKIIHIHNYYPTAAKETPHPGEASQGRQRIFISYKRGAQPDEALALHLYEALSRQHDVFIDQEMAVGTHWLKHIQAELEICDFLVPLLSDSSVHSEMVEYEISSAHHAAVTRNGKPRILPIRVSYTQAFDYPLSAYLNHLNWAVWNQEADTIRLVDELLIAISGGELGLAEVKAKAALLSPPAPDVIPRPRAFADPAQLERPDGTMDPESKFYIERPGDLVCRRELARQGVTLAIKAPRQMGKSSMLVRATGQARQAGKAVAFLDFQLLDDQTLKVPADFFKGFCHWIADELGLDDRVEEAWKLGLGNVQLCTKYMRQYVLKPTGGPVVLAMDEVDRMLDCPFASDFFGMLRGWHNSRRAASEWQWLDLLLVISTEPYLLINDLQQSPFNVGEVIRLDDFTREQIANLNTRSGEPFNSQQLDEMVALIGGHPYLTRQALYRVSSGEYSVQALFDHAEDDRGPFGDHLRRHLARFNYRLDLSQAMRQIIRHHTCPDETLFERLHGAGLVRRDGNNIVPRCGLYAAYFQDRLENV